MPSLTKMIAIKTEHAHLMFLYRHLILTRPQHDKLPESYYITKNHFEWQTLKQRPIYEIVDMCLRVRY